MINDEIRNRAKLPHNIFMLNLAVFHLLMTPAAIALDIGLAGVLLPLGLSLATMLFTYIQSEKQHDQDQSFIYLHWKLAVLRYRYLLISYGITAILLLLGMLLAMTSTDKNMQEIMQTVFIRIAIMPVLVTVMVNFYLESNAISQASNGEVPDAISRKYGH